MSGLQVSMHNSTYTLSDSRVQRMFTADNKKEATYMGLWDRFKDLFRSDKKSEVLSHLYDFLHSCERSSTGEAPVGCHLGPLTIFENLTSCANESYKGLFKTEYNTDTDTVSFFLGPHELRTFSLLDIIKSITVNGNNFLENFGCIVMGHYQQSHQAVSGAKHGTLYGTDMLLEHRVLVYDAHPKLKAFLTDHVTSDSAVSLRMFDSLNSQVRGRDAETASRRAQNFILSINGLSPAPAHDPDVQPGAVTHQV